MNTTLHRVELELLWRAACDDAGYVVGEEALLYRVPGKAAQAHAAIHFEPGSKVFGNLDFPLDRSQLASMNSPVNRDRHRIAVRDFESQRVALGQFRHELEHARQYDESPSVYQFMEVAQDVLGHAFYDLNLASYEGSAAIYNALPHERDANRAAGTLTLAEYGPPTRLDLGGGNGNLFRETGTPDATTLPRRLLATVVLFPKSFAWVASDRGQSTDELLRLLGPDAPHWWGRLKRESRVTDSGAGALAASPSKDQIEAADRPVLAWATVIERISNGQALAESIIPPGFLAGERRRLS